MKHWTILVTDQADLSQETKPKQTIWEGAKFLEQNILAVSQLEQNQDLWKENWYREKNKTWIWRPALLDSYLEYVPPYVRAFCLLRRAEIGFVCKRERVKKKKYEEFWPWI